jgi:hypothetical protein
MAFLLVESAADILVEKSVLVRAFVGKRDT